MLESFYRNSLKVEVFFLKKCKTEGLSKKRKRKYIRFFLGKNKVDVYLKNIKYKFFLLG